jgi:hypothetical protein
MSTLKTIVDREIALEKFSNRISIGLLVLTAPVWGPLWLIGYALQRAFKERT